MSAYEETARREAAARLLAWYAQAGVDAAVLDTPRDRFAETAAEGAARSANPRQPGTGGNAVPREQAALEGFSRPGDTAVLSGQPDRGGGTGTHAPARVAVPDDAAVADARDRAAAAATLEDLEAALGSFTGCNLRLTAKSLVFGNGARDADLMLVGEAPGRDEDIAGEPFVGKSGQLLDRMLASIGIDRTAVRVANTVPWRPPGNRPPTPTETVMCLPFLARHIELVAPKLLVCLGSPAAKVLLKTDAGILSLRGRWHTYTLGSAPAATIPALPMLHPAYLLRNSTQKKLAWRDLLALKERLEEMKPVG